MKSWALIRMLILKKVIALVKDQDGKVSDLSAALKEVTTKIDSIRRAQQLVKDIQRAAEQPEQDKKKERREER